MAGEEEEEEEDKATEQVKVSTNQKVMVPKKDLRKKLYPSNEWQLSYSLCWSHGMEGCN